MIKSSVNRSSRKNKEEIHYDIRQQVNPLRKGTAGMNPLQQRTSGKDFFL
jgi:hypothetical protein